MRDLKPRLLVACGWILLALAVAGMVLPLLPTVPFVLLAAACFLRSSERRHRWLVSHPVFGPPIAGYLAGRGLSLRAKAVALVSLWVSVLFSAGVFVPLLAADAVLLAVAVAVTACILRLPTRRAAAGDPGAD
jgi:hypothetical protein